MAQLTLNSLKASMEARLTNLENAQMELARVQGAILERVETLESSKSRKALTPEELAQKEADKLAKAEKLAKLRATAQAQLTEQGVAFTVVNDRVQFAPLKAQPKGRFNRENYDKFRAEWRAANKNC